jgi:hypothetical protein
MVVKAISYFIKAVDERDAASLSIIENPNQSGQFDPSIKIESKYKLNGFDIIKTGPFCKHS